MINDLNIEYLMNGNITTNDQQYFSMMYSNCKYNTTYIYIEDLGSPIGCIVILNVLYISQILLVSVIFIETYEIKYYMY